MPLEPPPEDVFETKARALKFAQDWARAEGYAVTTRSSAKKGTFIYLRCDRGGVLRNTRKISDEDRRRNTASHRVGCIFDLRIAAKSDGWHLTVKCGDHSGHSPSESSLSHAIQRRFDALTTEHVLDLARTGSRTRQIVAHLHERIPPVLVTSRDVANLISKFRRQVLEGRPPAEALVDWLREQAWPFEAKTIAVDESTNRLDGLLFAHPRGLELLSRFPSVIVVDATYSTNQNRLPLLHFVGFTSTNRSFTAALAFLPNETTMTYEWALSALKRLAPGWTPDVMVTDEDAALSAAIRNQMSPSLAIILCQW